MHVFFALSGYPCDPDDPQYQRTFVFSKTHRKLSWFFCCSHFNHPRICHVCMDCILILSLFSAIVAYLPKSKVDKNMNLLGNEGSKEDKSIPEVCC